MNAEPTIRQLRHFLSLAEHCHFGRAADACLITQSSLSASIRELELILDVSLFERSKRSVLLTQAGQEMIAFARDVVERLDALTERIGGTDQPLTGNLRLGVIPTIGPFLLPRVLPRLRRDYPDLKLFLREDHSEPLLQQLAKGDLDLVLIALPYNTEKLETFSFANDPFLLAFPRRHDLAEFETLTPARLRKSDLLTLEGGNCLTAQTLSMGLESGGGESDGFHATSLHTLVQMVANGLGVTVLPKMAVDAGILRGQKLDFRPFSSPGAHRTIALAWRQTSSRGDEFRLLGQFLRDELGTPLK